MSVEWDDGEKSALSPYTEGNKLLNISWLSKPLQLMVFYFLDAIPKAKKLICESLAQALK